MTRRLTAAAAPARESAGQHSGVSHVRRHRNHRTAVWRDLGRPFVRRVTVLQGLVWDIVIVVPAKVLNLTASTRGTRCCVGLVPTP